MVDDVRGSTWTGFHEDELDDWSNALKYDSELDKASCQAASSLNVGISVC